ncbi:MAG: hypothetical protein ACREJ5_14355 [Geminicoccaceae bacterium]
MRPIPTEHAPGRSPPAAGGARLEHLEQSEVEIDEESKVFRQRPPGKPRG